MSRRADERRVTSAVREVVDRTPSDRNRVIDLVRVAALSLVVVGHWLKQGLYVNEAGELHRSGLLGQSEWTHPLTWIFQVMPLIFAVGGFANAMSWRRALGSGEAYGTWLRHRTRRLSTPLLPLLALWAVAPVVAPALGLGDDWLHAASKVSLVATWFLASYLVVVALVPLTHAAWRRWGWLSVAAGAGLAAVFDLVSLTTDLEFVGYLNVLVVWVTLHQCGYAWLDRQGVSRVTHGLLLCALSLAALVLLVWLGPYGISMVGVDGHGVNNTVPPRVTLVLLGFAQLAGVMAVEPWLRRLAEAPVVWAVIVLVELRAMTIYLWHLTAFSLLTAVSLWLDGWGLHSTPSSREWWLLRPGWLLLLATATGLLVLLLGRFENPRLDKVAARSPAQPALEIAAVVTCLTLLGLYGVGWQSNGNGGAVAAAGFASLVALRWWERHLRPETARAGRRRPAH